MSAGSFSNQIYTAQNDETHNIKVQPETLALNINGQTNAADVGPATSLFWAETNRGSTEYGLRPRKVNFRWLTAAPDGYSGSARLSLPLLNKAISAVAVTGALGVYLGSDIVVTGGQVESVYPSNGAV